MIFKEIYSYQLYQVKKVRGSMMIEGELNLLKMLKNKKLNISILT